jgi:predicted lipoprotein with Yx(FWY)xxD motif
MRRIFLATLSVPLLLSGLVLSATAAGGAASPSRPVVKLALNKTLKRSIVVDGRGRTLYMLTSDIGGTTVCYARVDPRCPVWWHPLLSSGRPLAGTGIRAALLDTFKREDGRVQVRYNRHPLYYFHGDSANPGDKKPGEVNGQDFLHLWYVLSPKGAPIRK